MILHLYSLHAEFLLQDTDRPAALLKSSETALKFAFMLRSTRQFLYLKQKVFLSLKASTSVSLRFQKDQVQSSAPPACISSPVDVRDLQGYLKKKKEVEAMRLPFFPSSILCLSSHCFKGKLWKKRFVKLEDNILSYWKSPMVRSLFFLK
jgi:hypothetical protein